MGVRVGSGVPVGRDVRLVSGVEGSVPRGGDGSEGPVVLVEVAVGACVSSVEDGVLVREDGIVGALAGEPEVNTGVGPCPKSKASKARACASSGEPPPAKVR